MRADHFRISAMSTGGSTNWNKMQNTKIVYFDRWRGGDVSGGEPSEHSGSWEDSGVQRMRKPLSTKSRSKLNFKTLVIWNRISNSLSFGKVQHVNITLSHRTLMYFGKNIINLHHIILRQAKLLWIFSYMELLSPWNFFPN